MKRIFKCALIIAVAVVLAFSSYCLYKYISGPEVVVRPDTKKLTNRMTLYYGINVWDDTYLIWFTTVIRQDST